MPPFTLTCLLAEQVCWADETQQQLTLLLLLQQVDEAIPLLVAQDKTPAFHKLVQGLKAVHLPRNQGLKVQPANLSKPKQEAAPAQQVSTYFNSLLRHAIVTSCDLPARLFADAQFWLAPQSSC